MIESYWIILINSIVSLLVGVWIFKHFDSVFKSQVDITEKIIKHLTNITPLKLDNDYLYGVGYELDDSYTITTLDDFYGEEE